MGDAAGWLRGRGDLSGDIELSRTDIDFIRDDRMVNVTQSMQLCRSAPQIIAIVFRTLRN
jgi:hypothetical protein